MRQGPSAGPATGVADLPLSLLTFSTLYPHSGAPNHGVFVENRLRHLVATGQARSTVLAPVAWYPAGLPAPAAWQRYRGVPAREQRHGLDVHHPRMLVVPRLGMHLAPRLLQAASQHLARHLARSERVQLIDAHYLYPDGVAAVRIARRLGLPVVLTARGSDVTQLPDHAGPARAIRWAIAHADALVGVSAALSARLIELGADPERVVTLRNGVDLALFRPLPEAGPDGRMAARAALGLDGPSLISVGHLIPRKGHDRVIAALARLPEVAHLLIVGDGPERGALEALAARLGVAGRVRFLGTRPHAQLAPLYGTADALVLASSREGWANVLLEAMACGTAVVASPIPGNPEVVHAPAAGRIAPANTPEGLAEAIAALLQAPPARTATRAYAEGFGWDATSHGQLALFRRVLARRMPSPPAGPGR